MAGVCSRRVQWACAVENSMLFILDIIISLTQITGRGGPGVPCCGLKAKGVGTQSELKRATLRMTSGRSRNMYLEKL